MDETLTPTRELTPAGARLLAAASELFYDRGIRAVGVDLIADTAGTTKKTLYDRFGSKDALVALYLQRRVQWWQGLLVERLADHAPGADRALAVFDVLGERLAQQTRGCAFVNAYAEIGGTGHPGEPVIRGEKAWMRALFVKLAREAGHADPERLGAQLHLLYEGATVAYTAGDQRDGLTLARDAAARLLGV